MSRYVIAGGQRRIPGFSLIELLVALAVAATLLVVAVPAFLNLIVDHRLATRANEFMTALAMARSEALKLNLRVTLCKSANAGASSPSCDETAGWNAGWVLFVDNTWMTGNLPAVIDGPDTVLRAFPIAGSSATFDGGVNYGAGISYLGSGISRGIKLGGSPGLANGTFKLCDGQKGRDIVISATGRARVVQTTCGGS